MNVALIRKQELIRNGWKPSFTWRKTAADGAQPPILIHAFAVWMVNITFVSKNSLSILPFYQIVSKPGDVNDFKILAVLGNTSQQSMYPFGAAHFGPLFTVLDNMASWRAYHDANQIGDRDMFASNTYTLEYKNDQIKYVFVTVSSQTQHLSDKYKYIEMNTLYEIDTKIFKKYTIQPKGKNLRNMIEIETMVYRVTYTQNNIQCQRIPILKLKFLFMRLDKDRALQSYKKRGIDPVFSYTDNNNKNNNSNNTNNQTANKIDKIAKFKQEYDRAVASFDQISGKAVNNNQYALIPISPFMQEVIDLKHKIFGRFGIFVPARDLVNSNNGNIKSISGYFVLDKVARGPKHGAHGGLTYSLLYEIALQMAQINSYKKISRQPINDYRNSKNGTHLMHSEIKFNKMVKLNKLLKIEAQIIKAEDVRIEVQSVIFDPSNSEQMAVGTFVFVRAKLRKEINVASKL